MPYELHFSYVNLSQNVLPFVLRDGTTEMGNSFIEQLHESLLVLTIFVDCTYVTQHLVGIRLIVVNRRIKVSSSDIEIQSYEREVDADPYLYGNTSVIRQSGQCGLTESSRRVSAHTSRVWPRSRWDISVVDYSGMLIL